jgi:hypothetical protein
VKALLNPWAILALLVLLAGTATASYLRGRHDENNAMLAAQTKQRSLEEVIEAGIARGVSQIKVKNTTVRQTIESKTREIPVYRDCRNDPAVVGMLNDLLAGKASLPAGGGVVPSPNTTR